MYFSVYPQYVDCHVQVEEILDAKPWVSDIKFCGAGEDKSHAILVQNSTAFYFSIWRLP